MTTRATLYTVQAQTVFVAGNVLTMSHMPPKGALITHQGDALITDDPQYIQVPVHHIRHLDGSEDFIAIDPELEHLVNVPVRAELVKAKQDLEYVNALNRRLEDLSEALERRIETFAALPWYARAWRAITGDI